MSAKMNGKDLPNGTAWEAGSKVLSYQITPVDEIAALEDSPDELPRLANDSHCWALAYLMRWTPEPAGTIAERLGIGRPAFARMVCRVADKIGLPTISGDAHRQKCRRRERPCSREEARPVIAADFLNNGSGCYAGGDQ